MKPASTPDFRRYEAQTRRGSDAASLNGAGGVNQSAQTLPVVRENGGLDTSNESPEEAGPKTHSGATQPASTPQANNKSAPTLVSRDVALADAPPSGQKDEAGDMKKLAAPSEASPAPTSTVPVAIPVRPSTASSGWMGWFGKAPETKPTPLEPQDQSVKPEPVQPSADLPKEVSTSESAGAADKKPDAPVSEQGKTSQAKVQQPAGAPPSNSWFSLWGSNDTASTTAPATAPNPPPVITEGPSQAKEAEDAIMEDAPSATAEAAPTASEPPAVTSPAAGSTWAFWSRDTKPKAQAGTGAQPAAKEQGQIAVIGERSEHKPANAEAVQFEEGTKDQAAPADSSSSERASAKSNASKDAPVRAVSLKKAKRLRPQSMEIDESSRSRPSTPKSDSDTKPHSATGATAAKQAAANRACTPTAAAKSLPPNILLPQFRSTYSMENPSILRQIAQLLLRTQQPPPKHVFLAAETPKIKRALAIGVHGLFPAAYLRPMIGQPTGTSIKFANHCADSIRKWADAHGCADCEIEKVALEGEGRVGERVENLWKLLLNWIEQVRRADLIVVGCHSQGVPVAIMLLAKLIELGIITNARIGVCAMGLFFVRAAAKDALCLGIGANFCLAGVSLGPFPDYKSGMGMLMGTAAELWEFSNPDSEISKRYETSLGVALSYGVRVTFVGSIDDQLVPMEVSHEFKPDLLSSLFCTDWNDPQSAVYSPAHHPYIYRAVFIDGRIHAPDFIAHLVGFALRLRNLGVSDHGLIRELSVPLAGSLYSGEGHSRLYDDPQVYDLALAHTLETTDVGRVPCEVRRGEWNAGYAMNPNPYRLPWTMRGLLEEDFVKTELGRETAELLRQFDDWRPATKALKDVKYRLEAVRSKM
jgi:hypothetical protein